MVITEIFKSIQGEGSRAGLPCIFVRLTGCNLRCTWCDTAYAFHGGTKQSIDEVIARVRDLAGDAATTPDAGDGAATVAGIGVAPHDGVGSAHDAGVGAGAAAGGSETRPYGSGRKVSLVEITGGEPLLQAETPELMRRLLADGFCVMVETSGERLIGDLPGEVIKIVDVKCPDSGEPDTFDMANLAALGAEDEVKFVLSTRRDYEFARAFTVRHRLPDRVHEVLFSPAFADPAGKWPGLEPREVVEWILADGLPVRLGLQLHKFIWDPAAKGV